MPNLKSCVVDKVVQNCINVYNSLSKTGKPIEKEWTVLSCIVEFNSLSENIEVVSLGTGSKCIGASNMSSKGDMLNDSHSEIFARRGFLLYLYDNIQKACGKEQSIFVKEKERYRLKDNLEFIFYSSQLPCGDASIMPKTKDDDNIGEILGRKRQAEDICNIESKKQKTDDIHRTGAKCLPECEQDPKRPGSNYHTLGQVRTKPGRGERTLSVSCSDKLAKWIHMGFHGSLLDMIIEPIFIKHFIFGAEMPYSKESLERALLNRSLKCSVKPGLTPEFYQSSIKFPSIRTEENVRPAPGSIVWIKLNNRSLSEVAVHGKKLGLTKHKTYSTRTYLCISKYKLYEQFLNILQMDDELKLRILGDGTLKIPFNKMKKKSNDYNNKWLIVKEEFFKIWTVKPDIWDFCVDIM